MEPEDLFSEEDKNKIAYRSCVGATTLTGTALGSMTTAGFGAPVGFLAGLAWGVLICGKMKEPIKKKLFSQQPLSDQEVVAAIQVIRTQKSGISTRDALGVLAQIRSGIATQPETYKSVKVA